MLGNDEPEASVVGELVPSHEFYDYADKYVDEGARSRSFPRALPAETRGRDARRSRSVPSAPIDCSGLARVDFFLERRAAAPGERDQHDARLHADQHVPEALGGERHPVPALVDRLIALALERHAERGRRRLSFTPPDGAQPSRARRALARADSR